MQSVHALSLFLRASKPQHDCLHMSAMPWHTNCTMCVLLRALVKTSPENFKPRERPSPGLPN